MASDRVVSDLMLALWEEVLWPFWMLAITQWNGPERYGPHGELLLLLMQEKPTFVPDSEAFNSYVGDGFRVEGRK